LQAVLADLTTLLDVLVGDPCRFLPGGFGTRRGGSGARQRCMRASAQRRFTAVGRVAASLSTAASSVASSSPCTIASASP
jgi:hypothetical protein